ncbi:MAG TPA: serine/threonine-protein kinase, partial [Polyangiaceae bacterium]
FIVMELLEGETVEQRWERKGQRLAPAEVLAITEQLLDVLAAAHAKNVVHRDVKPENLFITKAGQLKVLDFGIARVMEAQRARGTTTKLGVVMGTPAFMSPEQARARWDEVDGRTDLWAVGATMFTMLTGRHVHEGVSGNEQLILSATTPAVSLGQVVQGLPPAVVAIVDRALAFDRMQRWPDAETMKQAVVTALAALGGSDAMVVSQQRPATSTMLSGGGPRSGVGVSVGGATVMDTSGTPSAIAAWTKERETRALETAKLRTAITELQQRYAAAKKGVLEAQAKVEAGRKERSSLQQWFGRQVGTRTAAVEEARKLVRGKMMVIARQAIADRTTFGVELDPAREEIVKLDRAAEFAQRDLRVHEAAIEAYDRRSLGRGVLLLGVAAALLLALVVVPIVWRATRVVDAPPPVPVTQPAPPSR